MVIVYPDREEIQTELTSIEDHVIQEVNRREALIQTTAQKDVKNVLNEISTAQHKRNRDIIREIVVHTKTLHA